MDDSNLVSISILVVLFLVHFWMEVAQAAITNFRLTPLRERAEDGDQRAQRLVNIASNSSRIYITYHLFQMILRFLMVAIFVVTIAIPFAVMPGGLFDMPAYDILAYVFVAALVTYIIGDLVPSSIGGSFADQLASLAASWFGFWSIALSPLIYVSSIVNKAVAAWSGDEVMSKAVTEEEIMTLVNVGTTGGAIEPDEKDMIYSVLQFGETIAREVMIPRPDVVSIDISMPIKDALKIFNESGHSRVPIYESTIDDIKGVLYAKDLLGIWQNETIEFTSIRALMRPVYFVPETKRADALFKEMQERRTHLAVIVDEYGGTAGLVTIEDLIEEIVGDIKDEYDLNEEAEYIELSPNEYILDGGMNLSDVNDLLDIDLATGENDSIGGYIYSKIGNVPEIGQEITEPDHEVMMRIEAVQNRRIRKVHVLRVSREKLLENEAAEKARLGETITKSPEDTSEIMTKRGRASQTGDQVSGRNENGGEKSSRRSPSKT